MYDRDRATPITLPRDAPVAQAKIDLALGHRTVTQAFVLQSPGNLLLRFLDRHAVEEARVDHAAGTVIGGVGDDEAFRILAEWADHGRIAEPVFVDKVEVPLVV